MRIGIGIGSAYYDGSDWEGLVELVRHADRAGVDFAWSAEAWGMETISPLAYLAPLTERIKLGTGIMQISARAPSMTAMTALTMNRLTNGRFVLGLGVSGPQVVEGLHGVPFANALGRLREYMTIVRMGLNGERLKFEGKHYVLPRPGGEGKALRLSLPPAPELPIYLATLGPKSLELTGELADGWLGTSFIPEGAPETIGRIAAGAASAGRSLSDIDIQVSAAIDVSDDVDALIEKRRPALAFTLGAMGSAKTNFYNAAYSRAGWADVAAKVQKLWVDGDKEGATKAVPAEFVLASGPIGTRAMAVERLKAYKAAGVNSLLVSLTGRTAAERIEHLEQSIDVIREASA